MSLRETIIQHNEAQEHKDGFYTIEYSTNDTHAAFINEVKAINTDNSFPYTAQIEDKNTITYSYFGNKDEEAANLENVIQYLDDLKEELLTANSANKIGFISKATDNSHPTITEEMFYIDGTYKDFSISINVNKRI